jgi:hypothetical protein
MFQHETWLLKSDEDFPDHWLDLARAVKKAESCAEET